MILKLKPVHFLAPTQKVWRIAFDPKLIFKDIVLKPFYSQAMSSSEAELREALAAARAMGVEPELLEEAEAMLCTKAAESELLSAMELVRSFELGGEVDEETWS